MTDRRRKRRTHEQIVEEAEIMAKLYIRGVEIPQLAAEFCYSVGTVYRRLRRARVELRSPDNPIARIDEDNKPLLITAAKEKLVTCYDMTEPQAHRWLQNEAQTQRLPLTKVAALVIALASQLTLVDLEKMVAIVSEQHSGAMV